MTAEQSTAMEYSAPTPVSRGLASPSPSTPHLAVANGNVLEIHHLPTTTLLHSVTTADSISHIAWGKTRQKKPIVAVASTPSNCVAIVDPETGSVLADVHDSPIEVASIVLSDSGYLLIAAEHTLALSVFCLQRAALIASVPFIKSRPPLVPLLYSFSPCSKFVAIVTRKDGVDGIIVIALNTSRVMFAVRGERDMASIQDVYGVKWLSSGNALTFWGSPVDPSHNSAVALMSLSGKIISSGSELNSSPVESVDEIETTVVDPLFPKERRRSHERRLNVDPHYARFGLGINSVSVNREANMLAIGCYDSSLRLVNIPHWSLIHVFKHDTPEISDIAPPTVFRERTKLVHPTPQTDENSNGMSNRTRPRIPAPTKRKKPPLRSSYFEVLDTNGDVEITKRVRSTTGPRSTKYGISYAQFSPDGQYLASRSDTSANVVFIWSVIHLRLSAVIVLEEDARSIRWSRAPKPGAEHDQTADGSDVGPQLAIGCGGENIYLWRESGAAAVRVRGDFRWRAPFCAKRVSWSSDNSVLVVADPISAKAVLSVFLK